jgi:iron complex outermembrane receptor protein
VAPFGVDGSVRYDSRNKRYFAEGKVHVRSEQTRIAITRGESPTDGYVTADLLAGINLWESVELRTGVMNLADKFYVNHLNAKNPFTGRQVPEPGRVFFTNVSYAF